MRYTAFPLLLFLLLPLMLSTIYLAAHALSRPPASLRPKIFVIGLSKTGTTSIGDALALLGYKRLGWKDIRSRHLVQTFIRGDTAPLVEQSRHYDAFEDLPWPGVYRDMAARYPDARFVLSLRRDERTWLESMRRHMRRGLWAPATHWYGVHYVEQGEDVVLAAYRNHTRDVRDFFRDEPHRYAELVVDDGDANWAALCRVAECPQGRVPAVAFPRSNTAADWRDDSAVGSFHRSWGWVLGNLEEVVSRHYYRRTSPVFNAVLERVWHFISVVELAICNIYYRLVIQTQAPLPVV